MSFCYVGSPIGFKSELRPELMGHLDTGEFFSFGQTDFGRPGVALVTMPNTHGKAVLTVMRNNPKLSVVAGVLGALSLLTSPVSIR